MKRLYRGTGLIALAWLIGSCGGADGDVGPPPPTVASVTLSRDTATLVPAATVQISAAAKTASGDELQRTISWSTSDAAKATVSSTGVVAGVAAGTATITAAADGKTATATITVLDGGIISSTGGTLNLQSGAVQIVVPSDALTSSTNLSVAASNAFAADPRAVSGSVFDFGPPGTNFAKPVVIKIRYNPAQLPSATEETALELYLRTATGWEVVPQSAADVGAKIISASVSHFSTYAVLTPEAVAAIAIGGASPLTIGQSEQLTATLTAADGRILSNRVVTWSSSDPATASISQTGNLSALKAGSPTISASAGGTTSSVVVTISAVPPPPVASVTVSPPSASVIVGATQQLMATLKDANNNTLTGRAITWSSNNAAATVNASGLVTGVSAGGPVTITATSEGKTGTSSITVNPAPPPPVNSVTVSPPNASIVVGGTQQLTAVTKDGAGNVLTGRTVTWSSNNAAATVNANGLVTGVSAGGPVTITATSEGKTGTSAITVTAAAFTLSTSPFITIGLASPVFLTQPLNDKRIFVVEQTGKIRVVLDGVLQPTPFLDLTSKIACCGERGLLSVAFHPQYATNHFFYVYFTGLSGEIRVERFTTTSNPEVADLLSEKLIFTTPHSVNSNHNGGLTAFGPDGMLYAAIGDGGGAGDVPGNAQNFDVYLGGMIRLDVDHGDPYSVPPDNPFVGQPGKLPELWAKGLRNPWRYTFDVPTGLLYIADVGQGLHEEVDAVPINQGGVNYGWNTMEGFSCFNVSPCNLPGLQLPILDYPHSGGACSITGGYVYRGSAMPAIQGHYFYSDFCAAFIRSLRYQNGVAVDQKDWGIAFPSGQITSFGQDAAGELYVISANSIFKLVPGN
jgi:uncharacterized protein YjdB